MTKEEYKQKKFETQIDSIGTKLSKGDKLRPDGQAQACRDLQYLNDEDREQFFGGNYYKEIKEKIFKEDRENSKVIKEYSDFIKALRNHLEEDNLDNNRRYKIKNHMRNFYDDMIWTKLFENEPVLFKDVQLPRSPSNSSYFEIDFNNEDDYKILLKIIPFFDYSDNLKEIGYRFRKIEKNCKFTDNQTELLNLLRAGKDNPEDYLFYSCPRKRESITELRKALYYSRNDMAKELGWNYDRARKVFDGLCKKLCITYKKNNLNQGIFRHETYNVL
jgi:hypothetical protein